MFRLRYGSIFQRGAPSAALTRSTTALVRHVLPNIVAPLTIVTARRLAQRFRNNIAAYQDRMPREAPAAGPS